MHFISKDLFAGGSLSNFASPDIDLFKICQLFARSKPSSARARRCSRSTVIPAPTV